MYKLTSYDFLTVIVGNEEPIEAASKYHSQQ